MTTLRTAIIGATGFVGGNLRRQTAFSDEFNSTNIGELAGRAFDLVVCAGARAEKWRINQDPQPDRRSLATLTSVLETVRAERFVHISTVDVYPKPNAVDENTAIDRTNLHPYGLNRLELEDFVRQRFDAFVVRLPGLFGEGLKKNIIFDFMAENDVDQIDSRARYQFYGLNNLWSDIERASGLGVKLVNFATEPVTAADIARSAFGRDLENQDPRHEPAMYDMWTTYGRELGGVGHYVLDASSVLDQVGDFVARERAR